MLLLRSIVRQHFPDSHTRHYISRPAPTDSTTWPANMLAGSQEAMPYDAIAELVFSDEDTFHAFLKLVSAPEAAAQIAANEENFLAHGKMMAVMQDGTCVTRRENDEPQTMLAAST
ncbi:hypothetical protein BDV95DRAFT_669084 [Massariosphaeria phaeospora]|uniref:EthD domain-containing protein n=1 Tax=Massariosphaeria phaeospora TaxID=100035 RepID=A0A7C8I3T5_9PLEO|nr:hypothetical protein BDV95DRAFT_669084 [Massariosphaeria phaeospora]